MSTVNKKNNNSVSTVPKCSLSFSKCKFDKQAMFPNREGLKSNTLSGSTHLRLPSILNSDMCLHAYDARGRWRHLMAKWRNNGGVTHAKSHSQSDDCKTKQQSQPHVYSLSFEDVWRSLNKATICFRGAEGSTWLSSLRETQSALELCDKNLMAAVSKLIDD